MGEEKMSKDSKWLMLSCIVLIAFVICFTGCSSKEEKDISESNPLVAEGPETDLQKPVSAVQKATAEEEKPSATVDALATEQKDTTSIGKEFKMDSGNKTPPVEVVLLSNLWKTHTKGAVVFTHQNHIKAHNISCRECHHVYEEGKNVWNEGMPIAKCETCHDEPTVKGERTLPPEAQKKNLKLAFHDNCQGCHKKTRKENPETKAPVKCSECHGKKE